MNTQINLIDPYIEHIANAVNEWKADNPPEALKRTVKRQLDDKAKQILLKLMGFNSDSFNREAWTLDHCNGRAGESAAGDFIRKHQTEAVKEWLSQIPLPEMNAKFVKSVSQHIKAEYERAIRDAVYQAVKAKAKQDAELLVNNICETKQLGNYVRTMELINAPIN